MQRTWAAPQNAQNGIESVLNKRACFNITHVLLVIFEINWKLGGLNWLGGLLALRVCCHASIRIWPGL